MVEGQLNQSDSQESTSVPCSKVASDLRDEQLRQKEAIQGNAELDKKSEKPNKKEHDQNFFSCNDGLSATKINERNWKKKDKATQKWKLDTFTHMLLIPDSTRTTVQVKGVFTLIAQNMNSFSSDITFLTDKEQQPCE